MEMMHARCFRISEIQYRIDAAPRYNPTSLVFFYGACSLFQKLNVVFRIG